MSIRSRIRGAVSRAKKRAKAGAARTKAKSKASGKSFRTAVKKQVSRVSKASSKRQAARAKTTQAKRQRTKAAATKYVASVKEQTKKSVERRVQRDIKAGVSEQKARRRQELRTEFAKGAAVGASFLIPAGAAVRAIGATTRGAKVVRAVSGKQVRTLATAGYLGAEGFGVYAAEDRVKQTAGAAGRIFGAGGVFAAARGGIKRTSSTIGSRFKPKSTGKRKMVRRQNLFGPRTEFKSEGLRFTREQYLYGGKTPTGRVTGTFDPVARLQGQPRLTSFRVEKAGRKKGSFETTTNIDLRSTKGEEVRIGGVKVQSPLDLPLLGKNYRGSTKGGPKRPKSGGGIDISGSKLNILDPSKPVKVTISKTGAIKISPVKKSKPKSKPIPEEYKPTKDASTIVRRDPRTGRRGTFYKSQTLTKTKTKTKPKSKSITRQKVDNILANAKIQKTRLRPKTKTKTKTKQKFRQGVLVGVPQFEKAGSVTITKMDSLLKYTPDIILVPPIGKSRTTTKRPPIIPPFKFGGGGGTSRRPMRIFGEEQAGRFTRSFTAQVLGLKAPKKRKVKRKYTGFELRI